MLADHRARSLRLDGGHAEATLRVAVPNRFGTDLKFIAVRNGLKEKVCPFQRFTVKSDRS